MATFTTYEAEKSAATTELRSRKTVPGTRLWNRVANFRTGYYEPVPTSNH